MLAGFTHQPVVDLSERLSSIAPGKLGHCFYASDGASAVEIALKMSFHYWRNAGHDGKTNFLGVAHGYHGETVGALSVTDIPLFRDAYGPLLRRQATVPSPDARLAPVGVSPREHALGAADALEDFLAVHHETVAALIVEPMVQGAAGMAMHDPVYLVRARELCISRKLRDSFRIPGCFQIARCHEPNHSMPGLAREAYIRTGSSRSGFPVNASTSQSNPISLQSGLALAMY